MARKDCGIALLLLLSLAIAGAHRNRKIRKTAVNSDELKDNSRLGEPELVTVIALKEAKFDFGDNATVEQYLRDSGNYDPKSVLPYDVTVDTAARNRIFVATPQVARGIPVSLSTYRFHDPGSSSLKPYPSLDVHRTTEDTITDCNTQLVSVFTTTKTSADEDTLYAMDSGVLDIVKNPKAVCPPKIVSFNLQTDKVQNVTIIEKAACNTIYTLIRVEQCADSRLVAYIADTVGFQLTVTDLTTGVSKHLQSQYFYPKPGYFFTKAGGPSTYLPYGLYGISGDDRCDGKLYMQGHATNIQAAVKKEVIRNANDGDILDTVTQVALPGRLAGPSGPLAADPSGQLLFFPQQDALAVYCWNTSKPHNPHNFRMIARDSERLQYFSHMEVDPTSMRLYLGTNRFTKYLSKTIDYSDYNYRLLYINLSGITC
ncbi:protein yellow-like [Schistocerca nitens]|uniref:protein yellow-like n=1 Tax=Schistocerca nitens TaxID=7011 RepID=UPI0021184DA8|nr:protein yellow-like [Schistocerca nitens]